MSLRWKVLILLFVVSLVLVGATHFVYRAIVLPGFLAAERAEALDDMFRCSEGLRRDAEHLSSTAHDWAAWDDTYDYAADHNTTFVESNLTPPTFTNNRLNLLAIVGTDGALIWGETRDFVSAEPLDIPDLLEDLARPDHPLVAHAGPESAIEGVVQTTVGLMLVASRPVVTSDNRSPVRGALIMGRLLDEAEVKNLAARTRVEVRLEPIAAALAVPALRALLEPLMGAHGDEGPPAVQLDDRDPETMRCYSIVRDVLGAPAAVMRAELPRTIRTRGLQAVQSATASTVAGAVALVVVAGLALQFLVVRPIGVVTRHAVRVGRENDLAAKLELRRRDEIGVLAGEFDRMVASLAESRRRMLETAHRAGMAEVAIEMLHNVGNVLNSVSVSAGIVGEKLQSLEVASLGQVAELVNAQGAELGRFVTEDVRGRHLPGYLAQLAECLATEQQDILGEVQRLSASIEHIREIIRSQEKYRSHEDVVESVDPGALLDEAVRLVAASAGRHHVEIVPEVRTAEPLPLHKHKVLQIVGNLLSNAVRAVKESSADPRRIVLGLECVSEAGAPMVRLSVRDNGRGIPPENLPKLFAFGFSTSPAGHGYGLHSAANMARQLGGRLTAASDGEGRGATFTLELPLVERVPST